MFFGKKKQNEELIEAITQHTRMCDARASELADMCRKWREERMGEDLKKAEEEIERLDAEISRVQELLSGDEAASNYEMLLELTNQLEQLQTEQEEQYEIWEELSD